MNEGATAMTCPVCFDPLTAGAKVSKCPRNHTFDRAREGYLNLLLADQKGSNDPGDDRGSVAARRDFLTSGHYDFLSAAINQAILYGDSSPETVADIGCGEGYFLSRLSPMVPMSGRYGLDISKSAMRLASRTFRECQWAVANIARRLHLADDSCDVLLSNMAPRNADEFGRILKPDGRLIVVIPGSEHLIQLTDHLMALPSDQTGKADAVTEAMAHAFRLTSSEMIQHTFDANQATVQRLVTMTPLRWKSQKLAMDSLMELKNLRITASFQLLQFAREGST
jgi:23S rRNA (guanine745-N1)-methyltransferase